MRGRFGPCATRQIFVRGQFAPGKDVPGHRAQSPKLRTLVTSSRDIGSRKSEASSSCRVKHNHFEPVEKMRGQSSTMITSDRLSSLTFWLISNPSPGLSSLLSEPLLSHLLVDLQPFSGNLLSDDIRTIPCRRRSPMIRARLLQNFSGTRLTPIHHERARCDTVTTS